MTEQIYPVKYIETLSGDIAHLFLFSDGLKYVVKFKDNKNRKKEVVNEYVVGKLAKLLSLPVVPLKLVYISDEFIKNMPKKTKTKGFKPGHQIATLFINNCTGFSENVNPPSKVNLNNRNSLAGMIVFDQWVNNTDRSRSNILIQSLQEGYYFHMIDHGRCFPGGYTWTTKTLKEKVQHPVYMPVYKWATALLNSKDELRSFTEQIVALKNESIHEVIQSIPEDWNVSNIEKESLFTFLIKQKRSLPNVVDMYIKRYHHLI